MTKETDIDAHSSLVFWFVQNTSVEYRLKGNCLFLANTKIGFIHNLKLVAFIFEKQARGYLLTWVTMSYLFRAVRKHWSWKVCFFVFFVGCFDGGDNGSDLTVIPPTPVTISCLFLIWTEHKWRHMNGNPPAKEKEQEKPRTRRDSRLFSLLISMENPSLSSW
jgi:hypothetical protein